MVVLLPIRVHVFDRIQFRPDIPRDLQVLLSAGLQMRPEDRPSAHLFSSELGQLCGGNRFLAAMARDV